jgi:hypothetical protein
MTRLGSIVVLMLVFAAALPVSAQNLVSPKLLPPLSSLHAMQNLHASLGRSSAVPANGPVQRKHWTRGGKVMTFVGAGVAAVGTVLLVHGASNQQQMFAKDEEWTGAGMLAGGSVLAIVGLTRHSKN